MQNVAIKTLDGEVLKINKAQALLVAGRDNELRCFTNKGEQITFDLRQVSEISFIIPLANGSHLAVFSMTTEEEGEKNERSKDNVGPRKGQKIN